MRSLLQLTLDLFSPDASAPPAEHLQNPVRKPRGRRAFPDRHKGQAHTPDLWLAPGLPAPASGPALSPSQLPLATGPNQADVQIYRHPQAKRQAWLEGVAVAYAFRRARRRTIGFSVDTQGLSVSAPRWVSQREIDQALVEKGPWIVRKLRESQLRAQQMESTRLVWCEGAQVPFLGRTLTLELDPSQRDSRADPAPDLLLQQDAMRLGLPRGAGAEQIRDAAQAWLMGRARVWFESRLHHFAPQLGVRWSRLSLSSAATRWGSAGADGSIRLHWRLIHFSPALIDYVVAHELSHLRVMDHSPRFWATVASVVPDYAQLRRQLRDHPMANW